MAAQTYLGDEPFICDRCQKAFSAKRSLEQHLRRSRTCGSNDESFVCDDCGRRFQRPDTLARHRDQAQCPVRAVLQCSLMSLDYIAPQSAIGLPPANSSSHERVGDMTMAESSTGGLNQYDSSNGVMFRQPQEEEASYEIGTDWGQTAATGPQKHQNVDVLADGCSHSKSPESIAIAETSISNVSGALHQRVFRHSACCGWVAGSKVELLRAESGFALQDSDAECHGGVNRKGLVSHEGQPSCNVQSPAKSRYWSDVGSLFGNSARTKTINFSNTTAVSVKSISTMPSQMPGPMLSANDDELVFSRQSGNLDLSAFTSLSEGSWRSGDVLSWLDQPMHRPGRRAGSWYRTFDGEGTTIARQRLVDEFRETRRSQNLRFRMGPADPKAALSCALDACGYHFRDRDLWQKHHSSHWPTEVFICELCLGADPGKARKVFISRDQKRTLSHVTDHHGVRDYRMQILDGSRVPIEDDLVLTCDYDVSGAIQDPESAVGCNVKLHGVKEVLDHALWHQGITKGGQREHRLPGFKEFRIAYQR